MRLRLTRMLPSLAKTKLFVCVLGILSILYLITSIKLRLKINDCEWRKSLNNTTEVPPITVNIKSIKMFYLNKEEVFIPSSLQQKDWHNYSLIEYEKQRHGIGEQGKPAYLPNGASYLKLDRFFTYGFNAALSEKIPLNRSLPDFRHPKCKKKLYLESLPTVSVIIVFHNEHMTTLLRTIFSVLYRSPENVTKEIILVDDASTIDILKEDLDKFVQENMIKIQIIHLKNRTGVAGARTAGAKIATADVLVFLDSHTEVNVNWLPPLLEPIALDYRTAVVPLIDRIDHQTLEYQQIDQGARGSFDWTLYYVRLPLTPNDKNELPEPFETPVMMGMVAISRVFFWELGGYDTGLDIWGGDNFELSFKIWQCGGRLLEAPCSRVGHIFHYIQYEPPEGHEDYLVRNHRRVAEVWMDEYAEYLYLRNPDYKTVDHGNVAEQKALRQNLTCKPFKWLMTQIAFDLPQQFPLIDPLPYAEGQIHPKANTNLYIDVDLGEVIDDDLLILKDCHEGQICPFESDQRFLLSWFNDVRLYSREMCWEVPELVIGAHVRLRPCRHEGGTQQWRYYEDTKHFVFNKNTCLDHSPNNYYLFLSVCNYEAETQKWNIDVIHRDQMAKWNESHTVRVTGPEEEWNDKEI